MEVETIGVVKLGWISAIQGCEPLTEGLTGIMGLIKIDLRSAYDPNDDRVILTAGAVKPHRKWFE